MSDTLFILFNKKLNELENQYTDRQYCLHLTSEEQNESDRKQGNHQKVFYLYE